VGLKDTAVDEDIQRQIKYLLLPGGRTIDKKLPPGCEAAAYLTTILGPSKNDLKTLHGFADRIGPLTSVNAVRVKPLPPPKETVKGVNAYKKYSYNTTKKGKQNSISKSTSESDLLQEKQDAADQELEAAIDTAHFKKQLRPLLVDGASGRRKGASVSNIKMLMKLNATLTKKLT
jgi:hypothetical protein